MPSLTPSGPDDGVAEREQRNDDVFAMLAARARRTSDGRLVAAAAVGIAGVAAVLLLLHRSWWALALPLLSTATFGIWGITDRVIQERGTIAPLHVSRHAALLSVRYLAAGIGTLAAVLSLLALAGLALGTWIS